MAEKSQKLSASVLVIVFLFLSDKLKTVQLFPLSIDFGLRVFFFNYLFSTQNQVPQIIIGMV